MSFLRFLMLLSLVFWIGGLIFFAFVLAPTAFTVLLPSTHLAGNVVGRALKGNCTGLPSFPESSFWPVPFFTAASPTGPRNVCFAPRASLPDAGPHADLAVRNYSSHGCFAGVAWRCGFRPDRQSRANQFDALHVWSTRVEGAVLLLGLVVVYLTAQLLAF